MVRWPDSTLFEGVADVADQHAERVALHVAGGTITYADLIERARRVSRGFARLGIESGDIVAVWLSNRPEWVVCHLALSRLGAAMVAVNTRYRTHELEYMLRDSGARALVTERTFLDNDYHAMLAEVVPAIRTADPAGFDPDTIPDLEAVVSLDPEPEYSALRDYSTLSDGAGPSVDAAGGPEDPVAVFYTSGTTSDPKGCLQPSRSLLNHSYNDGEYLDVTSTDTTVATLPFCGVWGYNLLFSALTHGASIAVPTHFEPARTLAAIEEHDVSYLGATAAMVRRMLDHESFTSDRVRSVTRAVVAFLGGGFDEADFERFEAGFDCPFVQPYGSSEGNSMMFVGDPAAPMAHRKRVGGPLVSDEIETKIVDPETREELPAGEQGELAFRGYNRFLRYLGKPEATEAAVDDAGWFYTGDLCTIDADGIHEYHARLDDALRTRGFLVAPEEIERAIDGLDGVDRSQVVGAPHSRHGEVPVAFVRADGDLDVGRLETALADEVADYKVPAAIEIVDDFPTTEGPNGVKIRKTELRDRAAALVEA
ncbi:MAG: class I adenylate-forming enzyme family protein [Salinirussus sp.]